jgi:predicted NBD/HSP70 family sugar kinase
LLRVRAVPPADLDVRLDNEANRAALWGALGTALAGVLDLLDVDTVVLGGGYATLAPWLVPAVTAQLRERVPAVGAREVRVMAGRLGPGAATLGAGDVRGPAGHRGPGRAARLIHARRSRHGGHRRSGRC